MVWEKRLLHFLSFLFFARPRVIAYKSIFLDGTEGEMITRKATITKGSYIDNMTGTDSEVVIIDNSEASVWPEKHEEIFIELMEEEVLKGNRNTTTFTKQSWKRIKEELYAQAKRSHTDTQLRNKYNLLRQKHKDFNLNFLMFYMKFSLSINVVDSTLKMIKLT
ncbi:hypothetical protein F8388_013921 [Cannabis sativa]|uniref:Myb/SANT-like domain-containing protein n=1 Tax=Cannabis sativa TaxID=3483 RepID=A0A7J6F863_CANSA|nr:hypothetical protein F8388_013921 [Cannabis sativa]